MSSRTRRDDVNRVRCLAAASWLAASAVLLAAHAQDLGRPLVAAVDGAAEVWRYTLRGAERPSGKVVVIAIDDRAHARFGTPLRRARLADAIRRLDDAGASAIVLTLPLAHRERPALATGLGPGDEALRQALAYARPPVTLGVTRAALDGEEPRPLAPFRAAAGMVLTELPAAGSDAATVPEWLAPDALPDAGRGLNHYGPEDTLPAYSLVDLLDGRLSSAALFGKRVVMGPTRPADGAVRLSSPYGGTLPMAEVLAAATDNRLIGRGLAAAPGVERVAMLALGAAAFHAAVALPPALALGIWLALALGAFAGGQILFVHALLTTSLAWPLAAIFGQGMLGLAFRAGRERRVRFQHSTRLKALRPYVPAPIAELRPEASAALEIGREQPVAVLFVDIAGFTSFSETLGPEATAAWLRGFYRELEATVMAHGGVVSSYLGDGAMAVFGVPEPRSDDAVRALACARALTTAVTTTYPGAPSALRLCVGLHAGPAVVACLGGDRFRQLTATGDTVNVASRLERLTRQHDAGIAVSGTVIEAAHASGEPDLAEGFVRLRAQTLRGRQQPLEVWVSCEAARKVA